MKQGFQLRLNSDSVMMRVSKSYEHGCIANMTEEKKTYRRWYDHDPMLLEVLDLLRSFESEVKVQAEVFIQKIEAEVGADTLDKFYEASKTDKFGNRWYDHDPTLSRAVELIRVVPPETQRKAAQKFLEAMKSRGLSPDMLKQQ